MRVEFSVDISGFTELDAVRRQGRLDRAGLADLARVVEGVGIDRLLLTDSEGAQDVATIASFILHATSTLGIEIEHRAGTVEPESAARQIATLDQLSGGRMRVCVTPPNADGLSHEASFARLDEYLMLLKRLWLNDSPIDHEGRFHRLKAAFSAVKPFNGACVPLALAGGSGTALHVAGRHAEVFVLPPSTVTEANHVMERVKAAARSYGRVKAIRFALPVRTSATKQSDRPSAPGVTVLPGSSAKVVSTLSGYCEIGVTDLIVSGLQTVGEVSDFGRTVAAHVRRSLAGRGIADQISAHTANVVSGRWSRYPA
jgi:alkanesulfonate monooxygenase